MINRKELNKEFKGILKELIPLFTNKEITTLSALPQNIIFEHLGGTGRRKVQTGINRNQYVKKFDRLNEIYEIRRHKSPHKAGKAKNRPLSNVSSNTDNDERHILENINNPMCMSWSPLK